MLSLPDLSSNSKREALERATAIARELQLRTARRKLDTLYPDEGPLRRDLYPKHMQFFAAGTEHRERCMMAGNRVGKTFGVGGYETTLHLTGRYPAWWEGRRFDHPIDALIAGDTGTTTRDIVQRVLFGDTGAPERFGTGLIPGDCLDWERTTSWSGIPGAFDVVQVRHVSGGWSQAQFRSYDQGRAKFQGTSRHLVWLDEEPPEDVYDECVMRTMTTKGVVLATFTPLLGLSAVALKFLPHLAPGASKG